MGGGGAIQTGFKAYPNPTKDNLTVETNGGNAVQHFNILNMLGQTMYRSPIVNKTVVNLSKFQSINDPKHPLSKLSENDKEETYVKVADLIDNLVK